MTKTYRDWSTDRSYLFPPSPHDWLPEGDLVYFLLDTVATLDLTPIFAHYERGLRGQPPFHPRMMVALLLYCYATGPGKIIDLNHNGYIDAKAIHSPLGSGGWADGLDNDGVNTAGVYYVDDE